MLARGADFSTSFNFSALLNGERCDAATLRHWLLDARQRTRALTDDLEGARELGPRLRIVNPPLWELGHIAWFQEHWCLRFRNASAPLASMIENADAIYNSAIAAHATRWELPLLPWKSLRNYQDRVLERVLERIDKGPLDEQLCYFVLLSVFHEDMHGEAFQFTRQTLAYSRPSICPLPVAPAPIGGDVSFAGGALRLGARRGSGFAFDNEGWEHEVTVPAFALSASTVSVAQFAEFVEDSGYQRDVLWSSAGRIWRDAANAHAPVYWHREGDVWRVREFDRWYELDARAQHPMMYINLHEAQAYCRWAGRRLPTEAEWAFAAERANALNATTPLRPQTNVATAPPSASGATAATSACWQWTTDIFDAFPGFAPGPYAEYSAPWFGDHHVLRGYSDQTCARMRRPGYRNFFTAERRDVRAGARTCALQRDGEQEAHPP